MRNWIKKFFIPHPGNDYRPHSLRHETVFAVLVVVFGVELLFIVQTAVLPQSRFSADLLNSVIVSQTNQDRTDSSLLPLRDNNQLTAAAQMKADDMAAKGYFAHVGPDGTTPWHWIAEAGYRYNYAGENLAANFSDSKDVVNAWMNSPAHRANILSARFTEVGIGISHGTLNGKSVAFIVQMFGTPLTAGTNVPKATAQKAIPAITREITQTPARAVLGEATASSDIPAVQDTEMTSTPTTTAVASADAPNNFKNIVGIAETSPRGAVNIFYGVLMVIAAFAVALKIGIALKVQHYDLIFNGVIVLVVLASLLTVNHFLAISQIQLL